MPASACRSCVCSMWSASKCCAVRRARCTVRARWAARCARCSTSPRPNFERAQQRARKRTEEGELGTKRTPWSTSRSVETSSPRASVGYHRDRGGYIDNVTLGRDDIDTDETSGGRVLLRYTPTDTLTIDGAVHSNARMRSSLCGSCRPDDYQTPVPTQLPVGDDFELYSLTLKWDLGFATLTGVASQFNRDLLATIDVSRFMAACRQCSALLFAPAVLSQPQDIEDRSHELRLSSGDQGRFVWTVGALLRAARRVHAHAPAQGQIRPRACRCIRHRCTSSARSTTRSSSALHSAKSPNASPTASR